MRLFHASFDIALDVGAAAFRHPAARAGKISAAAASLLKPMISHAAHLAATYDFLDPTELEHATFAAHHRVAYAGLIFRFGEWSKDIECKHFGLHASCYFQFNIAEVALKEGELDIEIDEYLDLLLPTRQLQAIAGHLLSDGSGSAWATHKADLSRLAERDAVAAKYAMAGHLGLAERRVVGTEFHATVLRHAIVWAVADVVRAGRHIRALENAGRAAIGFANMASPQLTPACGPREAVQVRAVMTAGEQFAGALLALGRTQWDLHHQRAKGINPSRRRSKRSKAHSQDMPDRAWGHLLAGAHSFVVKSPELKKLLYLEEVIGDQPRYALARGIPKMHKFIVTSRARRRAVQSQSARKPFPARLTLVEHHLLGFDRNEAVWLVAAQAQVAITLLKHGLKLVTQDRQCTLMGKVENVAFDTNLALDCPALQMAVEIVRREIVGDTKVASHVWWNDDLHDPVLYALAVDEQRDARALKSMNGRIRAKVANLRGRRRLRPAQINAMDNLSLSFRHRC